MAPKLDPSRIGRAVAEVEDGALAARERASTADRLTRIHAALGQRARGRARTSLRGPIVAGALLGAAAVVVLFWPRADPLRFAVGEPSSPGLLGVWIAAPQGTPTPIGFSDGTRIVVDTGARARVVQVSPHGARVVVERGTVRADVVPRPGNDWWVSGGPFEIHVTGTSFDAGWDPVREELSVTMHRGRVVVRAPCLVAERALVEGDVAVISCTPAPIAAAPPETSAVSPRAVSPSAARPSAEPVALDPPRYADGVPPREEPASRPAASSAPTAASSAAVATTAPATSAMTTSPAWHDLARAGRYHEALAAAEAEGFGALCDTLSAAEVMELGATARLAGKSARAVEAYGAVRRRFAGGDAAAKAAFHLGQLAFDGAHALGEAHRWFSTYLVEQPGGALAPEALGRAMEAEQRLGDLATARASATRYLARYPDGAHAALARSLLAP